MIPLLPFGQTGHTSTRVIFGAVALRRASLEETQRTFAMLKSYGINHIDAAPSYGEAEVCVGWMMPTERQNFFLATKVKDRTYADAKASIQRSLERLQVSQLDLLQIHEIVNEEMRQAALGSDGAIQAMIEAKEKGLTRFLGITGHGMQAPWLHLKSLEQYPFDAVLLPCNYVVMQNPDYAAGFYRLLEVCQARGVAVQTIKAVARQPWGDRPKRLNTWYEPLEDQAAIDKAVQWVLGQPGIYLNTCGEPTVLPKILDAASRYTTRPSDAEMKEMAAEQQLVNIFPEIPHDHH